MEGIKILWILGLGLILLLFYFYRQISKILKSNDQIEKELHEEYGVKPCNFCENGIDKMTGLDCMLCNGTGFYKYPKSIEHEN